MSKKALSHLSFDPPESLDKDQVVAKVLQLRGSALFTVCEANGRELLVEMPAKYRNKAWIKRGGYVVIDKSEFTDQNNKIDGSIAYVVQNPLKIWEKQPYWPKEFTNNTPADIEESSSSESAEESD
ncbi:translation initiation factor eIF1A-like protein [Schizosaccharomyces cryophilus OY26]|uniref:Translation initiation factor eIF1A-like protein n=1 Tax=Schizosaccharomyces cryophilus (strain OY26 / ATCC MYA-4695 / CBS 11777 / NBRC 106824 / NRRL Y48691) TaxID=653667 RepID=S9VNB4_SCHCR|nr:translation initiation factor eIF1A-like protein [Schizosaccharomyces cryophilus OY26]EPY49433.1 translation initiation factor eIF1A-like protein [Schizosaccharomyces cryophilus OY26]